MFHYQLKTFDLKINIAGVILNNIGGARHSRKAREAIETYTGTPVIGEVKRDESMKISMRHLGLIPVMEGRRKLDDFDQRISGIRDIIRGGVEIDTLIDIAGGAIPLEKPGPRVFIHKMILVGIISLILLDKWRQFVLENENM